MNKRIIIIRLFLIVLIILWMNSVFGFSNQDGDSSASLSIRISSMFSKDEKAILHIDQYVRKLAHYSEYGFGGILFFSFFSTFNIKDEKRILFSSIMGILYASSDEIHQLFISGRQGQVVDVLIDTMGVITGTIFMCLVLTIIKTKIYKKTEEVKVDKKS